MFGGTLECCVLVRKSTSSCWLYNRLNLSKGVYDDQLITCTSLHLNRGYDNVTSLIKLAQVDSGENLEFSHPSSNKGRQDKTRALFCIQLHANATAV